MGDRPGFLAAKRSMRFYRGEVGGTKSIPSRRTIDGKVVLESKVTIKDFEIGAESEPDRFTLKGMEVPVNTPVVDYRIRKRIGYWDGEGLSEWPVVQHKADR